MKPLIRALVLLLIVVLATGLYLGLGPQPASNDAVRRDTGAARQAVPPATAPAKAAGQTRSDGAPAAPGYLDFITSPDLGILLSHYLPLAEAGDPSAAELVDRVYLYCDFYLRSPGAPRWAAEVWGKDDPAKAQAVLAAGQRSAARCRSVNGGQPISDEMRDAASARAVRLGHPGALAREALRRSVDSTPSQNATALARAAASGDPGALFEAGNLAALSEAPPGSELAELMGNQLNAFAWQAAACRLGADCTAGGPAMDAFCLMSGTCGYAGYEDMLRHSGIPMAQWPLFEERIRRILALQQAASGG